MKLFRQGDLGYVEVDKIPTLEVKPLTSGTILSGGTGGHSHDFKGGKYYPKEDGNILGYLEAKNTTLFHPEHGEGDTAIKSASLPDGTYKVLRQVEETHEGFKQVID